MWTWILAIKNMENRMNKNIIICVSIVIIIITIFIIIGKSIRIENGEKISSLLIDYTEEDITDEQEKEKILDIVENQGFKANENIYEIEKEYDGREVVVVKSNIKYKVALAGMLKGKKPEMSEIDEILKNAPTHTGIWIAENSREKILELLKEIANATYSVDDEGFLNQKECWRMNDYDRNILEMLKEKKLHILNISSISYVVDDVTGEIQEYPFEEMDPYTDYEYFESEDKDMFIISENKEGKINQEEVLKEILN